VATTLTTTGSGNSLQSFFYAIMISSAFIKFSIAIILLVQVQVSAFLPPSASTGKSSNGFPAVKTPHGLDHFHAVQITRDVCCYAKNAFDNKNNIGGIGGLNINKTPPKKNITKSSIKSKKSISKNVKSVESTGKNVSESTTTNTPWSTIILAFLIPWKNPNSLFLYMIIIVSVLGKMNETPH